MKLNPSIVAAATVAAALLTPAAALAQSNLVILQERCSTDSLTPAQAQARLLWAWSCATKVNVVNPNSTTLSYDYTVQTGTTAVSPPGAELFDYYESTNEFAPNGYFGVSGYTGGSGINTTMTSVLFKTGRITETLIGGFQQWSMPTVLARPDYPTFGSQYAIADAVQLFPNPNTAAGDCTLYMQPNATQPVNSATTPFYVNGYCTSSCYTPEQKISFAGGETPILEAMNTLRSDVTTLTPSSTLQKIQLKTDNVASYTRETHNSTLAIFEIRTASGGELRVTDKHPVVEGSGRIVEARSLKVGDKLIKPNGLLDRIVSVTKTDYFGKVYNLKPKSTNRVSNLLIAQGYLVGSSRYQNEDVDYMNRIILGRGVPERVIPH